MAEIGFFIWHLSAMPQDPQVLADLCKQYKIKRLAIKFLNGTYKFNVPLGDQALFKYLDVLWTNGIEVEGWGYHYPNWAASQGRAIQERCQKLNLKTYHVNIEREWKRPQGTATNISIMLSNIGIAELEVLICSYRYPSLHPELPWKASMQHSATDGASPQVYFALRHDPVTQLVRTYNEYKKWHKPIHPIGPTFGATFRVGDDKFWWEPTTSDLTGFRKWCEKEKLPRIYYYSLDWLLSRKRYDWLEAATGSGSQEPPPPEENGEIPTAEQVRIKANVLNIRDKPSADSEDVGNLIHGSIVPVVEQEGDWLRIDGWIYKGWTEEI